MHTFLIVLGVSGVVILVGLIAAIRFLSNPLNYR